MSKKNSNTSSFLTKTRRSLFATGGMTAALALTFAVVGCDKNEEPDTQPAEEEDAFGGGDAGDDAPGGLEPAGDAGDDAPGGLEPAGGDDGAPGGQEGAAGGALGAPGAEGDDAPDAGDDAGAEDADDSDDSDDADSDDQGMPSGLEPAGGDEGAPGGAPDQGQGAPGGAPGQDGQ